VVRVFLGGGFILLGWVEAKVGLTRCLIGQELAYKKIRSRALSIDVDMRRKVFFKIGSDHQD